MQRSRRFIDSTGFAWQVWEIAPGGSVPADRAAARAWLYFFSPGTTLVLRSFPDEWEGLSWEALDALRRTADVLGSDSSVRLGAGASRHRYAPAVVG